ncbi:MULTISPECIES: DUF805 domain-containing protein [unclassified Burkholderia]|uniref:DUF805 domain-containing protein n=2 Tax=Burkholderia TaxID=32008 RepID=UPI001FC81F96|nr:MULTISPECIES: DUF805 domain-containing protein [unclassified Burkholderia]
MTPGNIPGRPVNARRTIDSIIDRGAFHAGVIKSWIIWPSFMSGRRDYKNDVTCPQAMQRSAAEAAPVMPEPACEPVGTRKEMQCPEIQTYNARVVSGVADIKHEGNKMNFTEAVRSALNQYAKFEGRARRAEYWYFALLTSVVSIVCQVITMAGRDASALSLLLMIVAAVVSLALVLPSLAVTVRRLHDTGRSGWFLLIAFIPIVGGILLLVWMCSRGTNGPNRFGSDPIPVI